MRRIGVLLAIAALVVPIAPATAADTGWRTITRFHGVRAQMCLLESTADYPNHVLFRINARHLESGWARAILSYKRPDDTAWRVWIPTHKAYPGEVHAGIPGSTEYDPKALRARIRLNDGRDRFRRYNWDDLIPCPPGAEPFPTTRAPQG